MGRFRSAAFTRALEQLQRFNRDDTTTLLLEGEAGTGKTVMARYLHATSARRDRTFQHCVLSSIDDPTSASDLFGHLSGAYTDAKQARSGVFLSANGGTLFLDEVGKASLQVQQKLLHVIEYGELRQMGSDRDVKVDVRLILATNVSLQERVDAGLFLPDLYARISAFRTTLPALRNRRGDIAILIDLALHRHARAAGYGRAPSIVPELLSALERAPWTHNLRELDSTVHRLMLEAEGEMVITSAHCRGDLVVLREAADEDGEYTKERIDDAFARAGTVAGAARLLGCHRATVYRSRRR